jgi:hypothetical protein
MMKKITKKKLLYFLKDEKKAMKEYHKYGFHNLEEDEREHYNYLFKLKKMV